MKQQSSNKLDALFQKAAEEYPLKTDNKNWDIVSAKLHAAPASSSRKKNRKWQYSALLLLLLGGSYFLINFINSKSSNLLSKQTILHSSKKPNLLQKNAGVSATPSAKSSINKIEEQSIIINSTELSNSGLYARNNNTNNISSLHFNEKREVSQQQQNQQSSLNNANINSKSFNQESNNPVLINKNALSASDKKSDVNTENEKSTKIKLKLQPKTFYGMLFFSPDFSTVKFQHVNKPGYSIGVGLGYRINNRISAEIALQRLHANFYSDGKYIDTTNLKLKSAKALDALNGNNKITEVPVDIKFNLLKNSDNLFATVGTTVALLTHAEKYDYNVIRNGSPHDVYREFSAATGTKFFTSINFSVGYQAAVSNKFNIKVEPYYQAATRGLGVGNLPVSNFGVNIGIIKDLK